MYSFDPGWLAKLEELRAKGVNPYPNGLEVTHTSTDLHRRYEDVEDPSEDEAGKDVRIGGRVIFRNRMGRAMFLRIQDRGGLIQAYVRKDEVGDETFELLKQVDIGDFAWVRGEMMRTRTGELTVRAREARLASKILTPFPDRWHSLTDVETRARRRYVDLFMNAETRETFRTRSRIISYIRRFFEERDFMEVETPMMQVLPGGAAAKPFVTHHNALGIDLYLRIAPELFLKRLVVGGLERVFEVNRNFRNEGIDAIHNPEFTMLEFYQAWATYLDNMDLTEELLSGLVEEVCEGERVRQFAGVEIDFTPPYRRASMGDLIVEHTGLAEGQLRDPAALEAYWRANQPVEEGEVLPTTWGKWWDWLFEAYVEEKLVNPTFVTGYPFEISPLARRNDDDPEITDRFELIVAGWEIANAFSELNDPVDQASRFELQAEARAEGDEESMVFDHDYVRALTYAMPPAAGEGIGIDRLVMLLTGRTSIREVILFPTLRPEQGTPDGS
jgi:lysyl-tRNA synthetase class 2